MCFSDFAREHTSIKQDRDGKPATITLRSGCDRKQKANHYDVVLSPEDAAALVSQLEAYERREQVSIAGDSAEGKRGKCPRLPVALRALSRGLCGDAPLSADCVSTPATSTMQTAPDTMLTAPTGPSMLRRLMDGLATNSECTH